MKTPTTQHRPIYIDIDGTLTDSPDRPNGKPIASRIDRIKRMVSEGAQVVIWSGNGTEYAKQFIKAHGIEGVIAIGKPEACVDDNPDIRPRDRMLILSPEDFFE